MKNSIRENVNKSGFGDKCATLGSIFLISSIFIDYFFGMIFGQDGNFQPDSVFRQILKGPILLFFLGALFSLKFKDGVKIISILLVLLIAFSLRVAYGQTPLNGYDLKFMLRGPFLALAAFSIVASLPLTKDRLFHFFKLNSKIWFIFITSVIIFHKLFGFGLLTYEGFSGYKSYFPSQNELTLIYSLSWYCWFLTGSWFWKTVTTIISLFVLLLIGTKSGFLFVFCGIVIYLSAKLYQKNKILSLVFVCGIAGCAILLINNIDLLVDIFLSYSHGGEKLKYLIRRLGVFSALWSHRDQLVLATIDLLAKSNPLIWINGMGFHKLWQELGTVRGTAGHFVEVDLIDALGGGGLLAVTAFLGPIVFYATRSFYEYTKIEDENFLALFGLLMIYIVAASTSGHCAYYATPSVVLGSILGAGHLTLYGRLGASKHFDRQNNELNLGIQ